MSISNVELVYSNELRVFDEKGKVISQRSMRSEEQLIGVGVDFYATVLRRDLFVFDEKSREIARKTIDGFELKNVSGNTINLKRGSTLYSFNKELKQINQRSIF
jgi:hypothetical protein